MKLKEKIKRFLTLDVHGHEGFTLVELIIVIAILAILSSVAVVGYSSYIKKANMQADKTMVSEIVNALTLYYYSNPDQAAGDFIILKLDANASTSVAGSYAENALKDAFGVNWATVLKLKDSNWNSSGLLDYVIDNADSAELIAGSTFLTTATPDGLMNAVNNMTDAATTVIQNYGSNGGDVGQKLGTLLGDEFVANLDATGVKPDDQAYETVISNMLVGHFAETLNGADAGEVMADEGMVGMMMAYATMYAYCETKGDTTTMTGIDEYLAGSSSMDNLTSAALNEYLQNNCTEEFYNGYVTYLVGDENGQGGHAMDDVSAALEIMGAVSHISGNYTDAETLSNPNLFTSEAIAEQLNNYISAVKAVAGMSDENLAVLQTAGDNAVVIFIAEDGSISVVPGAAYQAG